MGGSVRETPRSLRLYCALVGAASIYMGVFGVRGVCLGLTRVLTFVGNAPTWFWMLQLVSPLLQVGAGAVLLYVAWGLPRLMTSNLKILRVLFVVAGALLLAHGVVDWLLGFGLLSLAVSAIAPLIVWYLYANVRRFLSQRATDLTSAST